MAIVKVYTVDEFHDYLGGKISKTAIYRAIELKRLKSIKVGKRYLLNENAINDFLTGKNED